MLRAIRTRHCFNVASIILVMFFTSVNISAKSGAYKTFWIEHNVSHNGKNAIRIHYEYKVEGMKNQTGYNTVWIMGPDDEWRKVESIRYNPGYDNAVYDDRSSIIYVDDLKLSPGKHTYTMCLVLTDNQGNKLAQSDSQTFEGTVASNQHAQHSQSNSQSVARQWRENTYGGMFTIHSEYSDGSKQETMYMSCSLCVGIGKCRNCLGKGTCNWCGGRGMYFWSYSGWQRCGTCSGTGRCMVCHGSGKCACTDTEYPGYQIGGIIFKDKNGNISNAVSSGGNLNVNTPLIDVNSGNSSSSSSQQSGDRTCPGCHGTGKDGDEITYRTDYTGQQANEYCSQCGKWASPHYHRQKMCRICNGRGTVR